ncbi:MAG: hypothetical protein HS123_15620 [Solibacteraceae bacterium]|nr:hypothetical protein [Solibacteraceae bacterium]
MSRIRASAVAVPALRILVHRLQAQHVEVAPLGAAGRNGMRLAARGGGGPFGSPG